MNWAFLAPIEALWHSPAFPMWASLGAAAFFGIVLLITLLRADRSLANGALAIITLLAIGVAAAATVRGTFGGNGASVRAEAPQTPVGQGALACLDGLAGDRVEAACEKALFASADATAAAVSYTAAQISRLPVATTPSELAMLRRVLERDRYGLTAQVLTTREGCTPDSCETFRFLTNTSQIVTNMNERAFEALIARHEEEWNAAGQQQASVPGPSKGADIDYPSASSIPPVSIMTSEPPRAEQRASEQRASEPATQAAAPAAQPSSSSAPVATPHMALPPNSVPFPPSNAQAASPRPQKSPAPATKRASSSSAPTKRVAAPAPAAAPVQLVPPQ